MFKAKLLVVFCLSFLMLVTNYPLSTKALSGKGIISPQVLVCVPSVSYTQNTLAELYFIYDSGEAVNNTSVQQSVNTTFSRSASASITYGGYVEFSNVVAKVGVSAEVSVGVTLTISDSQTINVPAYTTVSWSAGSKFKKSVGKFTYRDEACELTYQNNVTTQYSFKKYFQWD